MMTERLPDADETKVDTPLVPAGTEPAENGIPAEPAKHQWATPGLEQLYALFGGSAVINDCPDD